ncbi:MAG: pirin family protein [Burkholderiales bacterium]|nr:pirin family protein [Burkholderiales bacterium]
MTEPTAIQYILKPHERDLGGFSVRRLLPSLPKQAVGPFIFFDHMGPAVMPAGTGMDVRAHPHVGLATVTYLFEGAILHRDSLGSVQEIRPGDINWMTAGRGIVHSERTPEALRQADQRVHGIQTWFALPSVNEDDEPGFWHYPAVDLPVIDAPGVQLRVLIGTAWGETSPVRAYGDTLYVAIEAENGASLEIPAEHAERGLYVASGEVEIEGQVLRGGQLVVFMPGMAANLSMRADSRLLLLGGEPLDGPRYIWWNFVATSKERIEAAKQRWQADEFPHVPGETERIPLPER